MCAFPNDSFEAIATLSFLPARSKPGTAFRRPGGRARGSPTHRCTKGRHVRSGRSSWSAASRPPPPRARSRASQRVRIGRGSRPSRLRCPDRSAGETCRCRESPIKHRGLAAAAGPRPTPRPSCPTGTGAAARAGPPRCRTHARGNHTMERPSWTARPSTRKTAAPGPPVALWIRHPRAVQEAPSSCSGHGRITRPGIRVRPPPPKIEKTTAS